MNKALKISPKKKKNNELIKLIKTAFSDGVRTMPLLKDITGETPDKIKKIAKKSGLKIKKVKDCKKEVIKQLIKNGVRSIETICEGLQTNPSSLYQFTKSKNIRINYHKMEPFYADPKMDALIGKTLSLREISEQINLSRHTNLSRQTVLNYINGSGQHKTYSEKRKEKQENKIKTRREEKQEFIQTKSLFLTLLKNYVLKEAKNEGFATLSTLERIKFFESNKKFNKKKSENYWIFYNRYDYAKRNKQTRTIRELTEGIDISISLGGELLKDINLKPMMYRKTIKGRTTENQKIVLKECYQSRISIADTNFFLGLSNNVVSYFFSKFKKEDKIKTNINSYYKNHCEVYEGLDAGFNFEELHELLNLSLKKIESIYRKRHEMKPKLIQILNNIHKDIEIEKPYLQKNDKTNSDVYGLGFKNR